MLHTFPSLRKMSCIRCGSSRHTLLHRKFIHSQEQTKMKFMNCNFPPHQAEAMVLLHSKRIISDTRHLKARNSTSEISTQRNEYNWANILKYTSSRSNTPSHIHHFNTPNELLDSMEERRLENYLSVPELDMKTYENKTIITYRSLPIYRAHTVNTMVFCVNNRALH